MKVVLDIQYLKGFISEAALERIIREIVSRKENL